MEAPLPGKAAHCKIAIIGAGFSGLGMAINLRMAGEDDFIVFEREPRAGGTWWVNQYPGCACDVASHLYCFSFEPYPYWPRMYASQPEIHAYLERCAAKYGIEPHLRLGTGISEARFDEENSRWQLKDEKGRSYTAQFLVSGIGALSKPALPNIRGLGSFAGTFFHSQRWDHGYDLRGKRIAVIGTGASAIQFVPQIQPLVKRLDLYQRTAPWILPKLDRDMTAEEKRRFRFRPAMQQRLRSKIYWLNEIRVPGFYSFSPMLWLARKMAERHRLRQIPEPELRRKATPNYTIGCKRILISNDYYPAICQPNVELITDPIEEITETGIKTAGGRERDVDAIIFGTGFNVAGIVPPGMIFGRGGIDLAGAWGTSPEAYKGTTVAGFPNLFMLLGPNTGLGHNSIVYMIEAQIAYVMAALDFMKRSGAQTFEVKDEAQREWNAWLQRKLSKTVWNTGGCRSWYLHPETGKNFALWPGFTWRFRLIMRRFDPKAYRLRQAASIGKWAPAGRLSQ
ncbi:MAG TPA: NAD(P)/FAD-dependent oxidoreductase [Hyphomicrobiales bacterium]|nr:NAD(P)/FAD-dependent oxidoreductase [Hyphomicrobiales bacterium]